MAFDSRGFKLVVDGSTRIWGYLTLVDSVRQIKTRGYFEPVKDKLKFGDWILVTCVGGCTVLNVQETEPLEMGTPL